MVVTSRMGGEWVVRVGGVRIVSHKWSGEKTRLKGWFNADCNRPRHNINKGRLESGESSSRPIQLFGCHSSNKNGLLKSEISQTSASRCKAAACGWIR